MSIDTITPSARIDHLVINVRDDLDAAEARYRRLGFRLTPRGHHTLGSSNHLAIFGTNYLELLGFPPGQGHRRPELLEHPLGLSGLAFRADDAARQQARLQTAGVNVSPVRHFSRPAPADGPDSVAAEVRFSTFQTFIEPALPGRTFYCQHHTPELVWRDEDRNHPNGATDIAEIIVVTPEPETTSAAFLHLAGSSREYSGIIRRIVTENADLSFVTPEAFDQRTGIEPVIRAPHTAHLVAVVLKTASIDATARFFQHGNVPFNLTPSGELCLQPATACGVTVIFSR